MEPKNKLHQIQGGGYFTTPLGEPLLFEKLAKERGHIDKVIKVGDEESIQAARDLAKIEGIFGGYSTGANLAAAVHVLKGNTDPNFSVTFLVCDTGLKYLSLDLYEKF